MPTIINDSPGAGLNFDLPGVLQKIRDRIRGLFGGANAPAPPAQSPAAALFARLRPSRETIVMRDPWKITGREMRVRIPGLRIDPQNIVIRPRLDTRDTRAKIF